MATLSPTSVVSFTLNGHDVQLSGVDPNTTLNEWIRSQLGLSGTKKMCGEGGCGCCAVSVQRKDPTTGKDTTISINSVSVQLHARTSSPRLDCMNFSAFNHRVCYLWFNSALFR